MRRLLQLLKTFFSLRQDVRSVRSQKDAIVELAPKVLTGWSHALLALGGAGLLFILLIYCIVRVALTMTGA